MVECYRCGISEERERLFDAVSSKGVVKICKKCANEDNLPLVQPVDLNKPEKVQSVYERLSRMANLDPTKHKVKLAELEREQSLKQQRGNVERMRSTTLRNVVDSNFEKTKPQKRSDLINNFHWVIMRARRARKLTQKQLAENIGESERLINDAEEGTILAGSEVFVKKLENYLGIKLRKGEGDSPEGPRFLNTEGLSESAKRELREKFEKEAKFDKNTTENLTINDLKEINEKKKSENSGGLFSFFRKKKKEESEPIEEIDVSGKGTENTTSKK